LEGTSSFSIPESVSGSDPGLSATPDWFVESDQELSYFGHGGVGTAGDVNGDGYSDLIIGAYTYDNGELDEGRAFVYYIMDHLLVSIQVLPGPPKETSLMHSSAL